MRELLDSLKVLPDRLQKKVAKVWAEKWGRIGYMMAVSRAPRGKTNRLIRGLRSRLSSRRVLSKHNSLARSVVIGAKPAFHMHLVVLGTSMRRTKGGMTKGGVRKDGTKRPGHRRKIRSTGKMPKHDFMAPVAQSLFPEAAADLKVMLLVELNKRGNT